jgi:hypothetical protein
VGLNYYLGFFKIFPMARYIFIFLSFFILFSGCSLRQREIELDKKTQQVNAKEQELSLKEQSLDFREQALNEREKSLDSTTKKIANDSLFILHPDLPGSWNVKMVCTSTNCAGSAIGDTKNEQWDFTFQDNSIIASASSNNKLVRVYTGNFMGDGIKLTLQSDSTDSQSAKMTIRLQTKTKSENEMEGEREIIQSGGCKIVYSLQLKKQSSPSLLNVK